MRQRVSYLGRVQGVGFRATVRAMAQRLHLTGWVRNEPDGTVLLEAQGRDEDLRALLDHLATAYAGFIRGVSTHDLPEVTDESGFHILR